MLRVKRYHVLRQDGPSTRDVGPLTGLDSVLEVTVLGVPEDQAQPPSVRYADVAETHSATVFFAGDRAYKLKKPVNLGFLDFTTRQARALACRRELELNRRFAPDVYLGLAEVREVAGGPAGRPAHGEEDGPGGHEPCDYLLVMRRMPADRRLSTLIEEHAPVADCVRQVARSLAAQHARAPRGPQISHQGGTDALWQRWRDNVDQTVPFLGPLALGASVQETERLAARFVAGRNDLFQGRIAAGRIVDGHGDLLADDIFCLADGPRIIDCLDFDDRLRWLDGLDDAACLAMDLQRLGAAELAGRFMDWYAEYSADPAPRALRHHYVAYRAFMRAKVSCMQWAQGNRAAGQEASRLAELALEHLRAGAVTLVLIGGLPGTGKSTLAGQLADRLGFTVLSSDRIRKELAGIPAGQPSPAPYGAGIYTAAWTNRTYDALLRRAAPLLSRGESVIADASWNASRHRRAAAALAGSAHADLVQLRCTAPAEVAARRLRMRGRDVSDADEDLARELAAAAEPWKDAIAVDTGGGVSGGGTAEPAVSVTALTQAYAAIRPHTP